MTLIHSPLWLDPKVKPPRGSVVLDLQHPLARGLVGCWIDAENQINEDYSPRGNLAVGVNRPLVVPGSDTLAVAYDGGASSQYQITQRVKSTDLLGPLTVAQRVQPRGSFVNHRNTIFRGSSLGQIGIIVFGDATWTLQPAGVALGGLLELNRDYSLAYTVSAAGSATGQTYQDGRPVNSGTVTIGTQDQDLTIGADVNNGRYWNGLIYYTYLYNRALSASEIAWLHAEPYAMFRPVAFRVSSIPRGGTYVASGGVVFDGAADTVSVRSAISYGYTPSGGAVFGGAARIQIGKKYIASGGLVFDGAGDVVADVAQVRFDIFRALDSPLAVFFDILIDIPALESATAEFDVYEGVVGVTASFDIYSEKLRVARTSEDVQMPVADWQLN